jgi:hypothetical protein
MTPRHLATVLVLVAAHGTIQGTSGQQALSGPAGGQVAIDRIAASTDVSWLGQIAVSQETATQLWRSGRPIGQEKDLRIAAYTRLGALGTRESLAEQSRIEDTLRHQPLLPEHGSLGERWTHPGWHMTDPTPEPVAQLRAGDGRLWALVPSDTLGERQLFLLLCDSSNSCDRPKPVGPWSMRYTNVEATLTETGSGRMQLRLVPKGLVTPSVMDGTAPLRPLVLPAAETRPLVLDDIERDSDGDGWTDIEERTLGLNPSQRDTDRDGLEDGRDPAPDYAAPTAPKESEDVEILQRAIFTAFGLTGSRWVLFAKGRSVPRLEPWGLPAPVIYEKPLKGDPLQGGPGGVFVTWRIATRTATDAVVEISDWEGPLAAGGQQIHLRRLQHGWAVVARQTTWIS